MTRGARKYRVVIAENNWPDLTELLQGLQFVGAQVKIREGRREIIEWKKPEPMPPRTGSLGDLAALSDNLEFYIFGLKGDAALYVERNAGSVDLVLMNRSTACSASDMDGFVAARYMRDHGYKRWIALQTTFLLEGHKVEAENAGVNEVFQRVLDPSPVVYAYIVQRYLADRKPKGKK